jgi:bifunctional lysine-specific demethylase and histidyl-hydroxylase NO66
MTAEPLAASAADDVLADLVGDADRFVAEHFGRAPLLRREAWPGRVPLSVDDVDDLLTGGALRWPAFRLVEQGRTLPARDCTRSGTIGGQRVTDLPDVGRVLAHVDGGATLVLQGLHRYHAPVAELSGRLERALSHPVQANAYLTPPGSRGLNVHHDTHDVFALQTHGHKHWVVHEPAVEVPLPSQPWSSDRHEAGPTVLDTQLAPGDVLYLPRGAPHAAETVGEVSLHLTIGVRVQTYYDLVQRAARRLGDDVALREALPAGWERDPDSLAATLADRLARAGAGLAAMDPAALVAALAHDRRTSRPVDRRGQLRELVHLDDIDDDTVVARRPGLDVTVAARDERVALLLPDREVLLPRAAEGVVTDLLDGSPRQVGDLADRVDAPSRRVLVRRLVREGALVTTPGHRGG